MEWLTNMREELNDQERENGDGFSVAKLEPEPPGAELFCLETDVV